MLVMAGVRTEAHTFRSQVGIRSESDCLLGQLKIILDISDSDAGLKEEQESCAITNMTAIARYISRS